MGQHFRGCPENLAHPENHWRNQSFQDLTSHKQGNHPHPNRPYWKRRRHNPFMRVVALLPIQPFPASYTAGKHFHRTLDPSLLINPIDDFPIRRVSADRFAKQLSNPRIIVFLDGSDQVSNLHL